MALDKTSSSKRCMTPERILSYSESGNTWYRRQLFKADWYVKHGGPPPFPFDEASSAYMDTDDETKDHALNCSPHISNRDSSEGITAIGKGEDEHLKRMRKILESTMPMEWFLSLARIITDTVKAESLVMD